MNGVPSFSEETILETQNLSRQVGEQYLVDNISISVRKGDVLAIVGPSGAGKSSFLRLINRLDEPTNGTVYIENQDYLQISPRQLRQMAGMVMQQPNLFPGTVAENIRYGPAQRGEHLSDEALAELLTRVALQNYQSRNISTLSGGESQRVSLARTLANSPKILLLDEPTSALDLDSQDEVERLLLNVIQDQMLTCLIVTHDIEQAARMANRVMMMKSGRLIKIGPVAEVLDA